MSGFRTDGVKLIEIPIWNFKSFKAANCDLKYGKSQLPVHMVESMELLPVERIIHTILLIRGQKVLLDKDLALMYGVTTKRLNEQVRRYRDRFPADFMFRLTGDELDALRSQFATSKTETRGGRRYAPYVFTEQGVVFDAIRELMKPPPASPKRRIGFVVD
jgi:hypothetical protein